MARAPVFLTAILCCAASIQAAPGYDYGFGHGLFDPPIYSEPLVAPIVHHEPIIVHAPIIKTAPVIKTVPIYKTIAAPAATSYATVTSYHISHPIVKTIIAAPSVIKTYAPSLSYGYH